MISPNLFGKHEKTGKKVHKKMHVKMKTKNRGLYCETPIQFALLNRNVGNLGKLHYCLLASKHAKIGVIRSKSLMLDLGSLKNKIIGSNYLPPTGLHV